ncbi:hypothetical protein ACFWBH_33145 [Streptomyces sp. NPDC059999]
MIRKPHWGSRSRPRCENDSRAWVAPRLEAYLRSALSRPGEDWYR